MSDFLQIYLSSFWAWAGITYGAIILVWGVVSIIETLRGSRRE